ncbi:MAG: hypothetical protein Q7S16_02190 [bacterium]|nr:hypothetical protein [bacterium]
MKTKKLRITTKVYEGSARATLRAKRAASSAPSLREQRTYARVLHRALRGKKNPRVLVLGATPELRDIVLASGATCLAVDWSVKTLIAMHEVMHHANNEGNSMMRCDWKTMDRFLSQKSFDAIMGDVSLSNINFFAQQKVLSNCAKLLKRGGMAILRHSVYLPEEKITHADWQRAYDARRLCWISVWPFGHYVGSAYDPKGGKFIIDKLFREFFAALASGKIHMKQGDIEKLWNVYRYGKDIIHWVETKDQFERRAAKLFRIIDVIPNDEFLPEYALPIYVLRKP